MFENKFNIPGNQRIFSQCCQAFRWSFSALKKHSLKQKPTKFIKLYAKNFWETFPKNLRNYHGKRQHKSSEQKKWFACSLVFSHSKKWLKVPNEFMNWNLTKEIYKSALEKHEPDFLISKSFWNSFSAFLDFKRKLRSDFELQKDIKKVTRIQIKKLTAKMAQHKFSAFQRIHHVRDILEIIIFCCYIFL